MIQNEGIYMLKLLVFGKLDSLLVKIISLDVDVPLIFHWWSDITN